LIGSFLAMKPLLWNHMDYLAVIKKFKYFGGNLQSQEPR
jgi:hypothetical protein